MDGIIRSYGDTRVGVSIINLYKMAETAFYPVYILFLRLCIILQSCSRSLIPTSSCSCRTLSVWKTQYHCFFGVTSYSNTHAMTFVTDIIPAFSCCTISLMSLLFRTFLANPWTKPSPYSSCSAVIVSSWLQKKHEELGPVNVVLSTCFELTCSPITCKAEPTCWDSLTIIRQHHDSP